MSAVLSNGFWLAPAIHPAFKKLERFKTFENGWAFGEGQKFALPVYLAAEQLLSMFSEEPSTEFDVFPGRSGQIVITLYCEDFTIDFVVFADEQSQVRVKIEYDFKDDSNSDLAEFEFAPCVLTLEEILTTLGGSWRWRSSGLFTQTSLIAGIDDSRAQHFNHQATALGYRSSIWTAPLALRARFAHTRKNITAS
jgi:hypothetical protein